MNDISSPFHPPYGAPPPRDTRDNGISRAIAWIVIAVSVVLLVRSNWMHSRQTVAAS